MRSDLIILKGSVTLDAESAETLKKCMNGVRSFVVMVFVTRIFRLILLTWLLIADT